ncbi:hypothetical protein JYU34_021248 [Plutella xylostella]|uniref:Uncharacterized protein n=1 Tax=Plutella xylostella TaxID=51655 RepID=A0ABQ7PUG1_PLUXY|nr:hypothetical protein JYU34_021248 [Plutella xylostella]
MARAVAIKRYDSADHEKCNEKNKIGFPAGCACKSKGALKCSITTSGGECGDGRGAGGCTEGAWSVWPQGHAGRCSALASPAATAAPFARPSGAQSD